MKNIIIAVCRVGLCAVLLILLSCSTATMTGDSNAKTYTFTAHSSQLPKSRERIDQSTTYELYFTIFENVRCIELSVTAQDKNGKRVRSAYVLELLIDLSRFPKQPAQPIYTEIAKNFDSNWRFQNKITMCSDMKDPLRRLSTGTYRLRITPFSNNFYNFTVDINSPVPIEFSYAPLQQK